MDLGTENGFITSIELSTNLPSDLFNPEEIESTKNFLKNCGIELLDIPDEEKTKNLEIASHYSQQPEEKIITVSRIKESQCPFRYYKSYIEDPKQEPCFESIESGIGKFFHSYLESHFRLIIAQGERVSFEDEIDVDDLVRSFKMSFIWEGRLRDPYRIVRRGYSLGDFIERLERVGMNFNEFFYETLVEHEVLGVEGQLQIRAKDLYIRGKHDLLTKDDNGTIYLWDWKSGRMPKPDYFIDFQLQKIQLGIYAIWTRYKFKLDSVKATAVFLRDDVQKLSETFHPDIEEEVLLYMERWRSRLNSFERYPPIENNLCSWCGWKPVCPAFR